jgi:hypothetical protein
MGRNYVLDDVLEGEQEEEEEQEEEQDLWLRLCVSQQRETQTII